MRTMCGSDEYLDRQYGMMNAFLKNIENDGLMYFPQADNFNVQGTTPPQRPGTSGESRYTEQHPGARLPCHQEADPCEAALSSVRVRAEDDSRLRGDAQDPEGAGSLGEER